MTQYLRCQRCNRYLIICEDGFWRCPDGHGGAMMDTHDVEPEPEPLPGLFITGEEIDDDDFEAAELEDLQDEFPEDYR